MVCSGSSGCGVFWCFESGALSSAMIEQYAWFSCDWAVCLDQLWLSSMLGSAACIRNGARTAKGLLHWGVHRSNVPPQALTLSISGRRGARKIWCTITLLLQLSLFAPQQACLIWHVLGFGVSIGIICQLSSSLRRVHDTIVTPVTPVIRLALLQWHTSLYCVELSQDWLIWYVLGSGVLYCACSCL